MMRRAGWSSVRVLCPAAAVVQRRWCTPPTPASTEGKPDASQSATDASQEAFKIHPKKVEASEAISGSAEGNDDAIGKIGSDKNKPASVSDAILDVSRDGYDKFGIPEKGSVEWYSRKALLREGRAEQVKAIIHDDDSTAPPIMLAMQPDGLHKKNVYDYTPDIPKDVKPLIGWMWTQHRDHFDEKRHYVPQWRILLKWILGACVVFGIGFFTCVTRLWMSQPGDIAAMRQEILQHSYGRVLELGAGSGSNIGIHPYPVTEIVMADRSEHQLQRLRYRLPKTSYPKYQVRLVDVSGSLSEFEDNEFDTIVDMFGLCHYADPVATLMQMQRVCKPTGTIIMLEHGKSFWPGIGWIMDSLAERHTEKTQGCRWNLPMEQYFLDARLVIKEYKTDHFGTTKYIVAYPEPREGMTSIVEEEKTHNSAAEVAAAAAARAA